jgi:hypothetical protein
MIKDIWTPKDVVKEEQVNICDICYNELNTITYLNITSNNYKKIQVFLRGKKTIMMIVNII